jgi:hypothetical protein
MFKKFKSLLLAGVVALCMCGNVFADGHNECYLGNPNGCESNHNGRNHIISNITKEQWEQYTEDYNKQVTGYKIVQVGQEDREGYVTWIVMHGCSQVECVKVKYNKVLTEYEKFQKIGKPDIPGSTPETGDASTLMLLGTVALSVAGLFILRDKKDEE